MIENLDKFNSNILTPACRKVNAFLKLRIICPFRFENRRRIFYGIQNREIID